MIVSKNTWDIGSPQCLDDIPVYKDHDDKGEEV